VIFGETFAAGMCLGPLQLDCLLWVTILVHLERIPDKVATLGIGFN
jgi:hypothetical protein